MNQVTKDSISVDDILKQDVQTVILDTDVLNFLKEDYKVQIEDFIRNIQISFEKNLNKKVIFYYTDISVFEFLKGANLNQKSENLEILSRFKSLAVSKRVFYIAAEIASFLKKHNIDYKGISSGDFIISAAAFLTSSAILTANEKHYPPIFFNENFNFAAKNREKNGRTKVITLFLLSPDYEKLLIDDFYVVKDGEKTWPKEVSLKRLREIKIKATGSL